jgi:ABC-type sugar transport system permease subunit
MPDLSPKLAATTARPGKRNWLSGFAQRGRLVMALYLLMAPTIISMLVFSYYPKFDVVRFAFYRWTPGQVQEWVGLKNFTNALTDKYFLQSLQLVLILLAANLVKMWPSIFTAIVLHRLKHDRLRYVFQVLFVIPMVIPALVWVLIWKSFYDPNLGLLNRFLNVTGLMSVLRWLDGVMPQVATSIQPILEHVVQPAFGSVWGLGMLGFVFMMMTGGIPAVRRRWILWILLLLAGLLLWGPVRGGLCVLLAAVIVGIVQRGNKLEADTRIRYIGLGVLTVAALLVLLGKIWTDPTYAFEHGNPAWLAHSDLVIPAVIFWGFPWVGVVGVMIYLAGLQQISQDVYEAAELDGVGSIGKVFRIELPLILAQVRINLIFMTMRTLTAYGIFLLLLGASGGPGGKGLVPGLYMYQQAFIESKYGYACALGMYLFIMILALTVIYQKYVKVEK